MIEKKVVLTFFLWENVLKSIELQGRGWESYSIIIVGCTGKHHPNGQCFFTIVVWKRVVKLKKNCMLKGCKYKL